MNTWYCARASSRVGLELARDEAALRALRHDDDVLERLRALQAEHLGAEVVGAIAVAQAAARDLAAAQVDALDAGRVDVDLEHRARPRHVLDERALDLDRDRVAAAGPVVVRAARRLEQVDEVAEDQVLLDHA